jgi:peptidoglycan/LPS O-acetylase OafA/YrhL
MGSILLIAAAGGLVFLSLWEFRRYRLAQDDPSGLPYPRSRLIRRCVTAGLGVAILLGLALKPADFTPGQDLSWYGVCMILTLLVLYLAVKDLREASVAAVEAHRRYQEQTVRQLDGLLEEARRASRKSPRRR